MSSAPSKSERILWLDMEMTGLSPASCVPIEVAAIVTEPDLSEVGDVEAVIHQPEEAFENMAPIVVEMHTANGLLDRVRASQISLQQADEMIADLVKRECDPGKTLLAGNTIHQDRLFIRKYFPATEELLHYRMIDVSSIKELVRRWYGEERVFNKRSNHTAKEDIRTSIAELSYYRRHCMLQDWTE
jgi:oligoribonuclease